MRKTTGIIILLFSTFLLLPELSAQSVIRGRISDNDNEPVFLANVAIKGQSIGTMTRADGMFELRIPDKGEYELVVSCVGYKTRSILINTEENGDREIRILLEQDVRELTEVSVSTRRERATTFNSIDVSTLNLLPNTSGSIESIIKTLPGVSSNNELSSQYSVRGGNFDENLVYVNDIEIYRPFLVRSGQQEGLSFINSDLISSIRFSAGGFDARYGDKMSSVLDIRYRDPDRFAGSASISLLGGSLHLEDALANGKFTYLAGFRYKTTAYLLNSLETEGDYEPRFTDFQSLISYRPSAKLAFSLLTNVSLNEFNFVPQTRKTEFGTASRPLNLVIFYEGNESDQFDTYLGAFTTEYKPGENLNLKFIASSYITRERENFDILGQYLINELDNTPGSETYGDSILNIGIGSFLNHARNRLDAYVFSAYHIGRLDLDNHQVSWGLRYENQRIFDRLSEWQVVDSSGFSLPYSESEVNLWDVIKAKNNVLNGRFSGFFQDTWGFRGLRNEYYITAGIRGSYQQLNKQFLVSPRATISLKPEWERDIMFHFSTGIYYQPPFFKEMRDYSGNVNKELKAQQSIHFVLGGDYIFSAWERPFKFTTELYYKFLDNLVPYKVDNVRLRYAGDNLASGYAMGIDFKINGEFVKGAESWASLSFLRTRENIDGDFYLIETEEGNEEIIEPGYYPRPTDQLMTFGLFFQDYLPNNPDYKVSLNFLYGSRLAYGSPDRDRYDNVFRLPAYRRVDIGFSKILKRQDSQLGENNPFRHFTDIWVSAEIFNLLGIDNTISYLWVRTVGSQAGVPGQFAVPNYLTSRRFNIKLTAKF